MQKVQLYIQGQRVDFFEDEKISVTQSIQDLKNPAKIFTDFSKTFNVPASKTNNKIFKHFYNFDIVGGFDARKKVSSEIKINFVSFKKGYIKLEGVKLKDNAPASYDITFFGETVILKDTIGENKLNALNWLSNFTVPYTSADIKAALQSPLDITVDGVTYNDAILAPLITHTNRLYYDSTTGHAAEDTNTGNLYYHADGGAAHDHGVLWSDLKYSIRLHLIIKAIEEQYPEIVFSDDFFNTTNLPYYNLYMWMHRKKGNVESFLSGVELFQKLVNSFPSIDIVLGGTYVGYSSGSFVDIRFPNASTNGLLQLYTTSTEIYNVIVRFNGSILTTFTGESGNSNTLFFDMSGAGSYSVTVESTAAIIFSNIEWTITQSGAQQTIETTASTIIETIFDFNPTQQIPDIKILDFLKGVFSMFNLTAYVNDEGIIVIDTLDNFYANFNEYDITQYVEVNESTVSNGLPYKQIDFTYQDYKTYLASIFNQLNNQQYGELKYAGENPDNWVGDVYSIKLPFQKMLYERLLNQNGNVRTTIQWGWMVDDNQEPYIGKPLLHYVNNQTGAGITPISFRDTLESHVQVLSYNIPLNSIGVTGTGQSLNFKTEIDEYAFPLVENQETLFENYYFNYISDVFKIKKRITKLNADLPLKVLLNYKLNDRFIVNGNVYKINSIKTDLQTGKSNLEIINE